MWLGICTQAAYQCFLILQSYLEPSHQYPYYSFGFKQYKCYLIILLNNFFLMCILWNHFGKHWLITLYLLPSLQDYHYKIITIIIRLNGGLSNLQLINEQTLLEWTDWKVNQWNKNNSLACLLELNSLRTCFLLNEILLWVSNLLQILP